MSTTELSKIFTLTQSAGQAARENFLALAASGNRSRAFDAFLTYCGVRKTLIARALGLSPAAVTRIINDAEASERHLTSLVMAGIPRELLPAPTSGRPGPRPVVCQAA